MPCNATDENLSANIRAAVQSRRPLFKAAMPHAGKAILVGGGPSAVEGLPFIRGLQNEGVIFALNGAGHWLVSKGITPDFVVVLDARPFNKRFVEGLPKKTHLLLASQVDPDLWLGRNKKDVTFWHAGRDGGDVVEERQTLLIVGGQTVGLRCMHLAFALGFRELHLFGYDSSLSGEKLHAYYQPENSIEGAGEIIADGRKFITTAAMAKQSYDFQEISRWLAEQGTWIGVYGDGLLQTVARVMQRLSERKVSGGTFTTNYDLGIMASSWDYQLWLILVMMWARGHGYDDVAVHFIPGVRHDGLPGDYDNRRQMVEGVIKPLTRLYGASISDAEGEDIGITGLMRDCVQAFACGGAFPKLQIPNGINIPNRPYITITLREADHWPQRNSNIPAWLKFAHDIDSKKYDVVFVRDTARAFEEINGFRVFPSASRHVPARAALYNGAEMNFFTNNGPQALCIFGGMPFISFKQQPPDYPPASDDWIRCFMGIESGQQLPWFTAKQKLTWSDDTYDNISEEWEKMQLCQ